MSEQPHAEVIEVGLGDISTEVLCCAPGESEAARAWLAARGDTATQIVESAVCPPGRRILINHQANRRYLAEGLAEMRIVPDPVDRFARELSLPYSVGWLYRTTTSAPIVITGAVGY